MTKNEFIKQLEDLLTDISSDERLEALQYYENYFEDAGPEREESIISELGSPAKVAASIKADLNASEQEVKNRGYFTEKGYEDETYKEPKFEIMDGNGKRAEGDNFKEKSTSGSGYTSGYNNNTNQGSNDYGYSQNRYNKAGNTNSAGKAVLIILLCIFAIPIGLPLLSAVFGVFIAVIATVASLWLAFVIVSIVLTVVGIAATIVGIVKLLTVPIIGICFTGGGLILFGLGLLFTMATIALSTKVMPVIIRAFINLCRLPFQNRRVAA
ncbi:DUF1700 domain-containing protein [Anaerocolumna sedimenticola]|uniref:DUF1700 domain-containing protein n=1 Tax=Anaerocolumna sedimenticola TaxID=2696063 RepID=A0A6P1TPH6_9FIRM|nr:DUF1700 domain-containing protein [Anaerocolumna sedimenticola]QHQ61791.1 DUF1700 domain-containing protein [Anaerocolumna sedimenticola]